MISNVSSACALFASLALCCSWFVRPTVCHCDCADYERPALDILHGQLERCGPESLGARPCPPCPQVTSLAQLASAASSGVCIGFLVGICTAVYFWKLWPAGVPAAVEPLAILDVSSSPRRLPSRGSVSRLTLCLLWARRLCCPDGVLASCPRLDSVPQCLPHSDTRFQLQLVCPWDSAPRCRWLLDSASER